MGSVQGANCVSTWGGREIKIRETSLPHLPREVSCHIPVWGENRQYKCHHRLSYIANNWALYKVLPDSGMQKHWSIFNPSIYLSFLGHKNEDLRFIRKDNFIITSSAQELLSRLLFTVLGSQANQPITWATLRLHEKERQNGQQRLNDSLQHTSPISSEDDNL